MSARTGTTGRWRESLRITRRGCGRTNTRSRSPYYGFEGDEPANSPPAGYIWTNAIAAGLTVRNYGDFVVNKKQAGADGIQMDHVTDPSLQGITNMRYRGFDLDYPDVERAKVFLDDLKQFESSGSMPRLMIVRLGNDHTNGTTRGQADAAGAVRG